MGQRSFENPVWVFVSDYFCRQVASAREAASFLREWSGGHTAPYSHAIAICTCALAGAISAESAREAFIEFAERERILVSEMSGTLLNAAVARPQLTLH